MTHLSNYLDTIDLEYGTKTGLAKELGLCASQVLAIFAGRRPCPPRCLKPLIDELGLDEHSVMKAAALDATPPIIQEWLKTQL